MKVRETNPKLCVMIKLEQLSGLEISCKCQPHVVESNVQNKLCVCWLQQKHNENWVIFPLTWCKHKSKASISQEIVVEDLNIILSWSSTSQWESIFGRPQRRSCTCKSQEVFLEDPYQHMASKPSNQNGAKSIDVTNRVVLVATSTEARGFSGFSQSPETPQLQSTSTASSTNPSTCITCQA